MSTVLEREPCKRCKATGRTTMGALYQVIACPACGGTGRRLTKRGAAAMIFLRERLAVVAADVKPGMVLNLGFANKPLMVTAVQPDPLNAGFVVLVTAGCNHHVGERQALHRPAAREDLDAALAYQATLTARGTPRAKGSSHAA